MDCLFCRIINGEIPSKKVYEDEYVYAFYDIEPKAPIHFLIVPKCHIQSLDCISVDNSRYIAHIYEVLPELCRKLGVKSGYRVVANCGNDGGQSVEHLHFHVLGGRLLAWPPG